MIFIAEVKTLSPYGFESKKSWDELFEIANEYGDWISIHVDSRWGGSTHLLKQARKLTTKPILAKGYHLTDTKLKSSFDAGADYCLVVNRIPPKEYASKCLIELNEEDCFEEFIGLDDSLKCVCNRRQLWNGMMMDFGNYEFRFDIMKALGLWTCQASNIKNKIDVFPKADAILVGEHLPTFAPKFRQK